MGPRAAGLVMGLMVAACFSQPARAEQGDWLFRAGATLLDPKKSNLEDPQLGELEFDDAVSPTISVAYMLTDHVATELMLAWPFEHDIDLRTPDGDVAEIGDVELFPPTLSLQWHFNPDGRIQPFVGAGVNYTMFSGEHLDGAAAGLPEGARLELDHSWGAAAQAGLNVRLSERWFVGADVRWIDLDSDARIKVPPLELPATAPKILGPRGQKAEIDPWLYGLYVGYRIPVARPAATAAPAQPAAPVAPAPPRAAAAGQVQRWRQRRWSATRTTSARVRPRGSRSTAWAVRSSSGSSCCSTSTARSSGLSRSASSSGW